MAKAKTKKTVKAPVTEKQDRRNQLKEMYQDFTETIGELIGDTGDFAKKHKLIILIGFVAFLWYRKQTFSIGKFIQDFESRIKAEKKDW